MARISRGLAQRRRIRVKEPVVEMGAVPIGQGQQAMGQREDDVDIRHVEQLPLARVEPALPRLGLALRAVPIPTRVIGDGLMAAGVTRSRCPPSAAVRQRAIARSTTRRVTPE